MATNDDLPIPLEQLCLEVGLSGWYARQRKNLAQLAPMLQSTGSGSNTRHFIKPGRLAEARKVLTEMVAHRRRQAAARARAAGLDVK
jgi:hypothetical protein